MSDDSSPSTTEEAAEVEESVESVGNLGEILPDPLQPLYLPIAALNDFRATHGETYIKILEGIVALVFIVGYVYWLYLFFVAG